MGGEGRGDDSSERPASAAKWVALDDGEEPDAMGDAAAGPRREVDDGEDDVSGLWWPGSSPALTMFLVCLVVGMALGLWVKHEAGDTRRVQKKQKKKQ